MEKKGLIVACDEVRSSGWMAVAGVGNGTERLPGTQITQIRGRIMQQ